MTAAPTTPPTGASATFHGNFRLYLKPDGTLVVPDLAEPLIPLLRDVGADESLWQKQPCVVTTPTLATTLSLSVGVPLSQLQDMPDVELWDFHMELMKSLSVPRGPPGRLGNASLLDLKNVLARRLLAPCLLCERRCGVNRMDGARGFCGLSAGVQLSAYTMLYNEGPLVGAPTFAVFLRGCSLRCSFCYRPDELRARDRPEAPVECLAEVLDQASGAGAQSWHFLGGNPDESLPGILQALALTQRPRPVVWNSSLMLTPPALELLKGVVDIWLPDFKFGNDGCARRLAAVESYVGIVQGNLRLLNDQSHVVVRHVLLPGHEECCTQPVLDWVRLHCPRFRLHAFPMQEPGRVPSRPNQ